MQGFFGFGFGILAMGGLTLSYDLLHAGGLVNLTSLVLEAWLLLQLRHAVLWGVVGRLIPPALVGVAAGVAALGGFDRALMVRALGATIIVIAAWNLAAPALRSRDTRAWDVGVGLLAGLLSGAFNTGGPPLVAHLYRRPDPPDAVKATIQALFLAMGVARLALASSRGLVAASMWHESAILAPVVVLGVSAGAALARRVGPERFRRACWAALAAVGVALAAMG